MHSTWSWRLMGSVSLGYLIVMGWFRMLAGVKLSPQKWRHGFGPDRQEAASASRSKKFQKQYLVSHVSS